MRITENDQKKPAPIAYQSPTENISSEIMAFYPKRMQFSCHDGIKTTKWLVTFSGLPGVIRCLILIVAIWISCFKSNPAVDRSTERTSNILTLVRGQDLKFDKSIENSRSAVGNLSSLIQGRLSSFSLKMELPRGTLSPLIEASEQISG